MRRSGRLALALLATLSSGLGRPAALPAGPPFVTDDPDPTEYRHWEIYTGFEFSNDVNDGVSASAPFAEFNYGARPNVQVSISLPLVLDESGGAFRYDYGSTDFGIKTRFVQESAGRPQVSFYPSIEIPGSQSGHVVTFLPIWLQKSWGPWTTFGGAGVYLNPGAGDRNSTFVGAAVERAISPGTTLGAELFHQSSTTDRGNATTGTNLGMISQIGADHAVLFSIGRALNDSTTFSAYASYEFELGPKN